jgi:hypothetical protein
MRVASVAGLLLLFLCTGCFTADVTITADGSGTMNVTYDPVWPTNERRERTTFGGPGVSVETLTLGEMRTGAAGAQTPSSVTARVKFESLEKLGAVEKLRWFKVSLADAGEGKRTLTVEILKADKPLGPILAGKPPAKIRVNLPGEVTESSAKIDGTAVEWTVPAKELFAAPLKMTATYKLAAAAGQVPATGGNESAPAKPAETKPAS